MKIKAIAVLAAMTLATPALAWEGQVLKCYGKVWQAPKYEVSQYLVKKSHTELEHNKHGQLMKVYYPAVYAEKKSLVKRGHWVMVEEPCKK